MPASRAHVTLPPGAGDLYCPACGAPVFTTRHGAAEHTCEHVRFVIDWEGELALAEPEAYGGEDVARQQRIIALVEQTESWDEFLDQVLAVLADSVVVMELSRSAAGGTAVVAFDFTAPEMA